MKIFKELNILRVRLSQTCPSRIYCNLYYYKANSILSHIKPQEQVNVTNHCLIHFHSIKQVKFTKVFNESSRKKEELKFDVVSNDTLESLNENIEELLEEPNAPSDSDISLSTGVLTVKLGSYGTYVINKQTPNQQIWLSSPFSGPKRYDFINNHWVYKHDGTSLHDLLSKELTQVFKRDVYLQDCDYGKEL